MDQEKSTEEMVSEWMQDPEFAPVGGQSWFLMEYDPVEQLAFGWVDLGNGMPELGYFSMTELEAIELPFHQKIERDLYFKPCLLSKVKMNSNCNIAIG